MAVAHLQINDQIPHGRMLRAAINKLDEGREELADIIASLGLMIDGNGSDAAHFVYMKEKLGCASNEIAKAVWDELNSVNFKLTTNASVDNVKAALDQVVNKLR